MKPVFRLDRHPRRAQPPLSEPPAGYFDQLPRRVMARLPQAEAGSAAGWRWLLNVPAVWRTSLASSALLVAFATSFWLAAPQKPVGAEGVYTSLDAVSRPELVDYLLSSEARVESADLSELTAGHPDLAGGIIRASDAEITDMLDAQPVEDASLL